MAPARPNPEASAPTLAALQRLIPACRRCPRLRAYGDAVAREKRKAYADQIYWGLPVPGWGDPEARLLLVGLAPGAHGAHRTGRMFTGDRSGDFLYAGLHRAGLASAPLARDRDDGLTLLDVYITAAVRCAPPANRPLPEEFAHCRPYLERELELLRRLCVIVALGRLAHDQVLAAAQTRTGTLRRADFPFAHAAEFALGPWRLLDCYHPSQQNTFTGRITPAMLDALLARARARAQG